MDPIANMFSSIKNALATNKKSLVVPFSKTKLEILKQLKKSDFILDCSQMKNKRQIKIKLNYKDGNSTINHLKRVSKPSLRIYTGYKEIPVVLNGFGDVIISTPKGLITGKEAKKQKVGGEIICEVY